MGAEGVRIPRDPACFGYIALIGFLPALVLLWMLRRGVPLAPRWTTLLAGLAAAGLGNFALRLFHMQAAGQEVAECLRVLRKVNLNVVGEVLKGQGQFVKLTHYPQGDVFDRETHAQYYYHAHRDGEHGHFHLFLRAGATGGGARLASGRTGIVASDRHFNGRVRHAHRPVHNKPLGHGGNMVSGARCYPYATAFRH